MTTADEKKTRAVLTGEHFINGNTACAEGALAAGCRFFAGYPITPSTEIAERMASRLPELGGIFIQMEDEIASSAAILGASAAGVKAMTATSGPGFSLMMEHIGLGVMMELPCVIVNIMRGGPSTGLPTLVGQADVMQARWGSHGVYEVIALVPNSPQEMFDLTVKAFSLSEEYRVPVLVLSDEVVGHMTEKVVIPEEREIQVYSRRKPEKGERYLPFEADDMSLVPPLCNAGEGYHVHFTGLTHDGRGYPVITAAAQEKLCRRLVEKIRNNAPRLASNEEVHTEDADVVVVAYGITSRVALRAVQLAREAHIKAGLFRPITIWPFPEKRIRALAEEGKDFVVVEINYGQIYYEIERCACGRKTVLLPKMGGDIHTPAEILGSLKKVARIKRGEL